MKSTTREAARDFANRWKDKGFEKGESQSFWLDLLQSVFGIENPFDFISFETKVKLSNTSYIDAYIPTTKVLIEQKSSTKDLRKPILQSDGSYLTPFQQAKRYASEIGYAAYPRWIVVSNFKSFLVYDMDRPQGDPFEILLENLEKEYYRLDFLVSNGPTHLKKEKEVSFEAGLLIGRLYNALLSQYVDPSSSESLRSLNILCVRIVFCLYAESAGLFGKNHSMFYDYLYPYGQIHARDALIKLFNVLNTPLVNRDPYLQSPLKDFPYVNGGLFDDKDIEIPNFTRDIFNLLLEECSADFDWSRISPTIFGAVFESTLNPETRKVGAMHYTSIENIHKVIDPLFLNKLRKEYQGIIKIGSKKQRNMELLKFQNKLASLTFLDPACGSGNFLTETYIALRKIENEIIYLLYEGDPVLDLDDPIKVSIKQFYGIEINDFAVSVAATALWIAEAQMWNETENMVQFVGEFLPLSTNNNIHHINAFKCDWDKIISPSRLNYILGNPPFIGARIMTREQKSDLNLTFGQKWKKKGEIDYVGCWFKKSVDFMQQALNYGNIVKGCLVATNSVSQGEQVAVLWENLFKVGFRIEFAYQSFKWYSEATEKAQVHCVIIGFSLDDSSNHPILYKQGQAYKVNNINAYLVAGSNVFLRSRKSPLWGHPIMHYGSMANDNHGCLSKYSTEERNNIIIEYPQATILFRHCIGADEFLYKKERWCIWLQDIAPDVYRSIPPIMRAIDKVKDARLNSTRIATRKAAEYPMLFSEIRQPKDDYLLIPQVNSEKRKYIPLAYQKKETICTHLTCWIEGATLFEFGILQSIVHMAWMRRFCGRLEMRTRYSIEIVYNNFPWPEVDFKLKTKIEKCAKELLNIRANYSNSSLADLYDELTMPYDLRKVHQNIDKYVLKAYGINSSNISEDEIVETLIDFYIKKLS